MLEFESQPKFVFDQKVIRRKDIFPSDTDIYIIKARNASQWKQFRPGAWIWDYYITPVRLEGFEHDEGFWEAEVHLDAK